MNASNFRRLWEACILLAQIEHPRIDRFPEVLFSFVLSSVDPDALSKLIILVLDHVR
jgi:hypothetical protein